MNSYIAIVTVAKADSRYYSDQVYVHIYETQPDGTLKQLTRLGGYSKDGRDWKKWIKGIIEDWFLTNNPDNPIPQSNYNVFFQS